MTIARDRVSTENLSEGGAMKNRDKESNLNRNVGMGSEEQSRRPAEGFGSSSGRQSGSIGQSSNISREDKSPGRSDNVGNESSSEGRH